ncbi:MAG: DUF3482 domain-containing protein [Pseudomonadota bacterium]
MNDRRTDAGVEVDAGAPRQVHVALVSHTNAGKTTLARTWLERDVGEVADRAHVTDFANSYVALESSAGDALVLWDTPGFGDSVRLLRRLRGPANPLGWFLSAVWDRWTDRPFWSSQQALRAARDSADLVLYVASAAEDPHSAAYVEPELEILDWLGKPVCVVLNQLGEAGATDPAADVRRWRERLERAPVRVVDVLPLDAFTRCWVQEHVLLARLAPHVPAPRRAAWTRLLVAWRERRLDTFERSMRVLGGQLAALAHDRERLGDPGLQERARAWLGRLGAGAAAESPEELAARDALAGRLDARGRAATDELVRRHGLDGRASAEILEAIARDLAVDRPVDPQSAGVLGGLVSGALGGLAADVAAGGLTFGAGAVLGGLLGAFGARGAAKAWNLARGRDVGEVRWSPAFLDERFAAALVRYLAVAHFGRGRGAFRAVPVPDAWRAAARAAVERRRPRLAALWAGAQMTAGDAPVNVGVSDPPLADRLGAELRAAGVEVLVELYPDAAEVFGPRPQP